MCLANVFTRGIVYCIYNDLEQYIGSTTLSLIERLKRHECRYRAYLKTGKPYYSSFEILKKGNYAIKELGRILYRDKKELHLYEGSFQKQLTCVNHNIMGRNAEEALAEKKLLKEQKKKISYEREKERRKVYYQKNKEKQKVYYQENIEKATAYRIEYKKKNKEILKEKRREKNKAKRIQLVNSL